MNEHVTTVDAAQTQDECREFVAAFARLNVLALRRDLIEGDAERRDLAAPEIGPELLTAVSTTESGIDPAGGSRLEDLLFVTTAMDPAHAGFVRHLLSRTGLSDKQQRALFPLLYGRRRPSRLEVAAEVRRLNEWLSWIRLEGFDPARFISHQRSVLLHGRTQNMTGTIGTIGAMIAFNDVLEELSPGIVKDTVGSLPMPSQTDRSPAAIDRWRLELNDRYATTILLQNGRAIVFGSSKDVTIFERLGDRLETAVEARAVFAAVRNDARKRRNVLHEHAVGEVKTGTDAANLHERMGLASRETQTELKTDRFLMMSLLTEEFLAGGTQGRTMNNRDLRRFSQIFNLHHCWGWDGGRERHPEHWEFFRNSVAEWCGL